MYMILVFFIFYFTLHVYEGTLCIENTLQQYTSTHILHVPLTLQETYMQTTNTNLKNEQV